MHSVWKPHLWCCYLILCVFSVISKHIITERNRICCRKEGWFFFLPLILHHIFLRIAWVYSILLFLYVSKYRMCFYPRFLVLQSGNYCQHHTCHFILVIYHFAPLFLELCFWVKLITGLCGQRVSERHLKVSVVMYSSSQM